MGSTIDAWSDQRFYADESLVKTTQKEIKLSTLVQEMILKEQMRKGLNEKQTKKLTAFYDELIKENL